MISVVGGFLDFPWHSFFAGGLSSVLLVVIVSFSANEITFVEHFIK